MGRLPEGNGLLGQLILNPVPLRLADLGLHEASVGFPPHHPADALVPRRAGARAMAGFRDEIDPADPERTAALFAQHDVPAAIAKEIRLAYAALCEDVAVAVRSSATAEDLPELSFAGQQDTYLNIRGDALLDAVRRCWALFWISRAVAYRDQHGVSHDDVALAVVVQELVEADAAGVLFTADPVGGARDETVINPRGGWVRRWLPDGSHRTRWSLRTAS